MHYGLLPRCSRSPSNSRARTAAARARAAAARAVELDDTLADAHAALALVRFRLDWDWPEAEREFRRALDLNPALATAHHFSALYLAAMDRPEEALAAVRRAQAIDPLSLIINAAAGRILHFQRRYDEAVAQYTATLDLDPGFPDARMNLGMTYAQLGRHEDAIRELGAALEASGRRTLLLAVLAYVHAVAGDATQARSLLAELQSAGDGRELPAVQLAYPYIGLGEFDAAFTHLHRAVEQRAGLLIYLKVEPMFDRIRGDARMGALLQQLRL